MTEVEKFIVWYYKEKQKGLIDIHFSLGTVGGTLEEVFKEINEAINAPKVAAPEF